MSYLFGLWAKRFIDWHVLWCLLQPLASSVKMSRSWVHHLHDRLDAMCQSFQRHDDNRAVQTGFLRTLKMWWSKHDSTVNRTRHLVIPIIVGSFIASVLIDDVKGKVFPFLLRMKLIYIINCIRSCHSPSPHTIFSVVMVSLLIFFFFRVFWSP